MATEQDDPAEDQLDDQPEGEEDETPEAEEGEGEEAESEELEAGEDDGEGEEPPRKKPASATIRELRERAQKAEQRLEEVERRVNAPPQQRDTAKEEADERAALAAMNDQEKTQYLMAKEIRQLKQQVGQVGLQTHDATDRAAFSAYITANPRFERYRDEVEKLHRENANRGNPPVAREFLLSVVVGQAVLKSKTAGKQKRAAAQRVDRQRTSGGSVRSNTGAARSKGGSLVQRMEDQDLAI